MDKRVSIIRQIKSFEKKFSRNNDNGGGKKSFKILEGSGTVLISAPHSTNKMRQGSVKGADVLTGGIALYLHKVTGCHLIYSSSYSDSDPNYDASNDKDGNAYKNALKEYIGDKNISVVIDLHG